MLKRWIRLLPILLCLLMAGLSPAGATVFAFTNPGVHATGPFTLNGSFVGRAAYLPGAVGVQVNGVATGTQVVLSYNASSSTALTVTVDGTPTTPTLTTGNVWSTLTIYTGLSDSPATHTVQLYWNATGCAVDSASFLTVTGTAPAIAFPSGWVAPTLTYANSSHLRLEDTTTVASFSGFPVIQSAFPDATFSFKGSCDTVWAFLFCKGISYRLTDWGNGNVLGYDGPTVVTPSTSKWAWVQLFTGLDNTTSHIWGVTETPQNSVNTQGSNIYALMLSTSGAAGTFDLSYFPVARRMVGFYGDSLIAANFGGTGIQQDSSYGAAHQISLKCNVGVYNRGHSGQTVTTYLRDHTSDITSLSPQPSILIMDGGINDMGGAGASSSPSSTFAADDKTMLTNLLTGTSYKIYYLSVTPKTGFPQATVAAWNSATGNGLQANVASVISTNPAYAKRLTYVETIPWLLTGSLGTDYATNFFDGLHPNPIGYGIWLNNLRDKVSPPTFRRLGSGRAGTRSGQNN